MSLAGGGAPAPVSTPPPPPPPPAATSHLDEANAALKLTPQERNLYVQHLTNLNGTGKVSNKDGSISTLLQTSTEHDGKTYNIPTVWDGKILPPRDAIRRAVTQKGWDYWPSYASEEQAESRYDAMHGFLERDTSDFLAQQRLKSQAAP